MGAAQNDHVDSTILCGRVRDAGSAQRLRQTTLFKALAGFTADRRHHPVRRQSGAPTRQRAGVRFQELASRRRTVRRTGMGAS
jgi:hypothetical protein